MTVTGGSEREVRVELDPSRLDALGVTASDISSQLQGTNVDLGSGRGQVAGAEQSIRTLGDIADVTSLANTTIALSGGRFVKLSDLGTVKDTYEEPKSFARHDGKPVVSFAVFRAKGASEVTVAETVAESLTQVRAENPTSRSK